MGSSERLNATLWLGVFAGPIAFLLTLQAKYALVDYVCRNRAAWLMWLITIAGLVLCAIGAIAARRGWVSDATRVRFMAIAGLALSTMFALAIIAMAIPDLFLGACE